MAPSAYIKWDKNISAVKTVKIAPVATTTRLFSRKDKMSAMSVPAAALIKHDVE